MIYKRTILLLLLFLFLNSGVYIITKLNEKQRVSVVLQDNLKTLKTHYEILLHTQKTIAITMYKSTIESKDFIEIVSQANSATEEQRDLLRVKLNNLMSSRYERAKLKGVLQYQVVFANNVSFLRVHKPSKFGDDLTNVRADFKYVNETKKPVRCFAQGRTSHGFRNTFPIFTADGTHIGAIEISFSSDNFQWFLNNISHIHTHFLVSKHIFDSNTWERDDLIVKYSQSAENKDYMITLGHIHTKDKCIVENRNKLDVLRKEIDILMKKGKSFSEYLEVDGDVNVYSFLPIKNIENKAVAWLVSYEESNFIEMTLRGGLIIRIISFLISLILVYIINLQFRSRYLLQQRHKLLDDMLNATDNVMFITDFKDVSYSNNRFKDLLNIKKTIDFNKNTNHNVLSVFNKKDGYLHAGLLKKGELPITLFRRIPKDERVVSILNKYLEEKSFNISISKTNTDGDYVITLSDITELKAKQDVTKEKAYIDGLTKVYNRNKFDEVFEKEMTVVKRYNHKLSIAIIDIDKFKDFNDSYGHLIGDEVLIMIAQNINTHLRETDVFARWGGEEFVILFKETNINNAKIVSLKLKDDIEKLQHPTAGNITVSFGLTEYIKGDTQETLFKRCDDALYTAKQNGRNRVEVL